MKIESQALDDHQIKLSVEFDANTLEEYKHKAARHLASRVRIPGFRPGKAPYSVVVRQVGESAIMEDALEHLVEEQYPAIIDEAGVKPYSAGQLEKISSYDPLVLEFIVPLEPEVILGDYHSIRRPYEPKNIQESDVDEVIENLLDRQAVLEPVDRPAAEGDIVTARLSGVRTNPQESQEADLVEENSYQFLVRSEEKSAPDEWPFPGFSRNLIGLSAGDDKILTHHFADDFEFESLRDATAEYSFKVEDVKSRSLPELNDDFAKSVGEQYESLDSLRVDIHAGLQQQTLDGYNQMYDAAIAEELVRLSTIKYPPEMVESEQNSVIENFKQRLEAQGSDLDLYLKTRNMDIEALKAEAKPGAEERIKRSLALLELAKAENIQISQEDLQTETQQTLLNLNRSLSPEDQRRLTDQRVMNNLVGNLMLEMLTERAQQRLHDIASGKISETEALPEEYQPAEELEETIEAESPVAIDVTAADIPVTNDASEA